MAMLRETVGVTKWWRQRPGDHSLALHGEAWRAERSQGYNQDTCKGNGISTARGGRSGQCQDKALLGAVESILTRGHPT